MPVVFTAANRAFAPTWAFTALTLALCVAFIGLGRWQWHRGNARQAEWDEFERGTDQTLPLGLRGVAEVPRFQRVSVLGRFDAQHQFLLDNRTYQGRAGYEVLTPFERPDGRVVLVDRGWVPFSGLRDRLPGVALSARGLVTIVGRVDNLPSAGLASGRAAPQFGGGWPKLTTYPTLQELAEALGHPLEPRILLLDAREPDGYVRDWHPPGMPPVRHWAYAVQWWTFAVLVILLWGILSTRKQGSSPRSLRTP